MKRKIVKATGPVRKKKNTSLGQAITPAKQRAARVGERERGVVASLLRRHTGKEILLALLLLRNNNSNDTPSPRLAVASVAHTHGNREILTTKKSRGGKNETARSDLRTHERTATQCQRGWGPPQQGSLARSHRVQPKSSNYQSPPSPVRRLARPMLQTHPETLRNLPRLLLPRHHSCWISTLGRHFRYSASRREACGQCERRSRKQEYIQESVGTLVETSRCTLLLSWSLRLQLAQH